MNNHVHIPRLIPTQCTRAIVIPKHSSHRVPASWLGMSYDEIGQDNIYVPREHTYILVCGEDTFLNLFRLSFLLVNDPRPELFVCIDSTSRTQNRAIINVLTFLLPSKNLIFLTGRPYNIPVNTNGIDYARIYQTKYTTIGKTAHVDDIPNDVIKNVYSKYEKCVKNKKSRIISSWNGYKYINGIWTM
jgi:hypothetical protein